MKSIKFYSFDVKAIVTKKSRVAFCGKGHTGIRGLWMQVLDAGLWTLDAGLWTLDAGCYTLNAGLWALETIVDCFKTKSEVSF